MHWPLSKVIVPMEEDDCLVNGSNALRQDQVELFGGATLKDDLRLRVGKQLLDNVGKCPRALFNVA